MTEQPSDYDHWAWLYNETLGPEYGREKIGFLERTFLPYVPAGGRVLDLCCGTGQLIEPLLARGYAVTGLDGSADMLRFARQNAPTADYVQADARDFALETSFDGVICTSASLNHMSGLDDLRLVFASVNKCLRNDGVFVFDINHPAQLARYWRGQPAEGEVCPNHAWLITPRYDAKAAHGTFTVDIYRRPDGVRNSLLKRGIGRVIGSRLLTGRRLALLSRFRAFQPNWEHRSVAYPVHGHDLAAVGALLRDSGFDFELQTIQGGTVDENHSAYFVCRKVAAVGAQHEPAQQEAAQ